MIKLFEDNYDGELTFDITDSVVAEDCISMDLAADYNGRTVGLRVKMPIQRRKMLFKAVVMPDSSRGMQFESMGEMSDEFLKVLDEIWAPDFLVDEGFDTKPVELEYKVLNKDLFDPIAEKTYTKVFYEVDLGTGDKFDNFNLEIGFNFNLPRARASIVERKRETRNDFIALLMA